MKQSSPRQKKNCLQNFDLSEHRQIISDLAIHIYHQFISVLEKSLLPAIGKSLLDVTQMFQPDAAESSRSSSHAVPGMLEHESLQGISSMKPTGFRKRSNSIKDAEDSQGLTISSIIQQLSVVHSTMSQHGMDEGLIHQVLKQMFYLVGAVSLNNIMLRKDMCSCRKGMQIRSAASFLFLAETNRRLAAVLMALLPVQVQHQLPG